MLITDGTYLGPCACDDLAAATSETQMSYLLLACRLLATVPAAELNKAQELLDKVQAALAEPSSPSDPSSDKAAQKLEQLVPSR